jgi:hypothetical protein
LARQYGCYGYRRVTALLRDAGWTVNRKRVERPGNGFAAIAALRFRFAPPPGGNGNGGNNALTIDTDHSLGADHRKHLSPIGKRPRERNGRL